jgi:protein-L-isoaspartate O-methyltransferase
MNYIFGVRTLWQLLAIAVLAATACGQKPTPASDFAAQRQRMVIPVGDRFAQQLYLLEKKNGQLKQSATLPVRFVPMTSEGEKQSEK